MGAVRQSVAQQQCLVTRCSEKTQEDNHVSCIDVVVVVEVISATRYTTKLRHEHQQIGHCAEAIAVEIT